MSEEYAYVLDARRAGGEAFERAHAAAGSRTGAGEAEGGQSAPLSVSAAMALAKRSLEALTVRLVGEVSEVSNKPGYKAVYFTVKDEGASLPCMMWLNRYRSSGVELRVGMLVELAGRFTLYAPKGRMNFDVFSLSVAGEGDLRLKVANLAKKLEAEGLMRPERKRALPEFPEVIGLVTSPRGAAVHDVLRTLRRRYPLARVVLAGVPVEGAQAPAALAAGLACVQDAGAQVVLLVRGGGSFEDLMPFNDEGLARAIASARVPVVTGIGHEPDTCIADMVADRRASTPTAAAEAASPDIVALSAALDARGSALAGALGGRLARTAERLEALASRPVLADPSLLLSAAAQSLDLASERLHRAIPLGLERDRASLARLSDRMRASGSVLLSRFDRGISLAAARLHDLSPLAVLGRGYALARDEAGAVVRSVEAVEPGSRLAVSVADGVISCAVEETQKRETELIEVGGADGR